MRYDRHANRSRPLDTTTDGVDDLLFVSFLKFLLSPKNKTAPNALLLYEIAFAVSITELRHDLRFFSHNIKPISDGQEFNEADAVVS